MKYLLLLAVVLAVLWLLRQTRHKKRSDNPASPPPPQQAPAAPTEIVACAHCGVHLPRQDALPGAQGRHYCGAAHRHEAESG